MTQIPKTLFGKVIEGSLERVLNSDTPKPETKTTPQQPLEVKANINLSEYIKIPNTSTIIQKYQSNNNLNWEQTHYKLNESGLFMPTPNLMTTHLINVINVAQGKTTLYDAQGNPISKDKTQEIYQYLTKDGHGGGVWTWLDAKFIEYNGILKLETDHRVVLKGANNSLGYRLAPLEDHLKEDCYVNLEVNSQGFPTKKSSSQKYQQGKNIYFYQPIANRVAGFSADSGGAGLVCGGNPDYSVAGLGVLGCALARENLGVQND